mgnify:CR=1 FL=1
MGVVNGSDYGAPTLDLNFARNKSLIDTTTGRNLITFTRSSTATYVGSDGLIKTAGVDTPRFDHDPVTRVCNGLLIEESRTNLVTNSANGINGTLTNVTRTLESMMTPNGEPNCFLLKEDNSNGNHRIGYISNGGLGNIFSLFVKPAGRFRFRWIVSGTSSSGAYFNLNTGSISYSGNAGSGFIHQYSNGWYRIGVSIVTAGDNRGDDSFFGLLDDSGTESYTGNGVSGAYIWGAQVESVPSSLFYPTSYIPTSGSTVTRSTDVATITGTNFSSWYNQSEGTLFQNAISQTPFGGPSGSASDAGIGFWIENPSTNSDLGFWRPATTTNFASRVYTGGAFSANFAVVSGWPQNGVTKATLAYKQNDFAFSLNGSAAVTDNSGNVATPDRAVIGQQFSASYNRIGAGTFSRISYYPKRLPNYQLQALTR